MNVHYYTTPLILQKERPALEEQPIEPPRFGRVFWIIRTFVRLLYRYWRAKMSKRFVAQHQATEVRRFLEQMGGIWIKVGQVLAMRTDLFSLEFCRELARLQDRSITFSPLRSIQIIEAALNRPITEVFDDFEALPFAAASLSQVHRARIRDTKIWVAIKVQRPFAREYFRYDLRWLRWFVRFLKKLGLAPHLRLDRMLAEISEMMEEELDYRNEASNMNRLSKILERHNIVVPKVYFKYSAERVLVMDYLEGVFMSDYITVLRSDPDRASAWLAENEIEPRLVARRLFQSIMRQLYEDLFFHADLHPGNIVLLRENRLAFIDFGNCGKVDQKLAAQYDQYFRAMSEQALEKAADLLLLTLGKLPPMDVEAFKKRVVKVLAKQISRSYIPNLPYRQRSIGSSSAELNQVMAQFKIEVNWDMLKMARAFESVDQNISVLNPDFSFGSEMKKYQTLASRRKKLKQLRALPNLVDHIGDFSSILLPAMIQRSLNLGGSVSKGIQIAAAIFGFIKNVLIFAFIAVIWTWLYQHHHRWVSAFHDDEKDVLSEVGLTSLEDKTPYLDTYVWFIGAIVILVILYQVRKFIRALLRPGEPVRIHEQ